MATFENTNTRVEVTKWYVIDGADIVEDRGRRLLPYSVKFTFVGDNMATMGDIATMFIQAKLVRKDGTVNDEMFYSLTGLFLWNDTDWPTWLTELREQVWKDFRADRNTMVLAK